MGLLLQGELAYKDKHGRVWHIQQRKAYSWTAETLDKGHTEHPHLSSMRIIDLLADIDREGYQLEPTILDSEQGTESVLGSDESRREKLSQNSRYAKAVEEHEPPVNGAFKRPEEWNE